MSQYPSKITTLDNGLRIVSVAMPQMQSVAIGIWACVGGRNESLAQNGISHLIEHLCFKGSTKRTSHEISRAIESLGGDLNAFTDFESTCYYAKVHHSNLATVLDVLMDIYFNTEFSISDIEHEKDIIKEEILMYRDLPEHNLLEGLAEITWPDNPLGRSLLGTFKNLESFSKAEIETFKKKYYTPDNTIISIAGNLNLEALIDQIKAETHSLKGEKAAEVYQPFNTNSKQQIFFCKKEIEQTHAVISFKTNGTKDPQKYVLHILDTILGGNMSSRLNYQIRDKHALAYHIYSTTSLFKDTGTLQISCCSEPNKTIQTLKLIFEICQEIRDQGISSDELEDAKKYITGSLALALEGTTEQMIRVGESLRSTNNIISYEEIIANVERVTLKDVQKMAQEILINSNLKLALASPHDLSVEATKLIQQFK